MSDNVNITPGTGNIVAADEVIDATLGTVKVQYTKIMDGTIDGTSKLIVNSDGSLNVKLETSAIEIGKVDQGLSGTLAGAWPVELSDGTNLLGVSAHPVRIDPTGTTIQPVSGTISISGTVPVSGTFFQATQPVSLATAPTTTVIQPVGTNLHVVVDSAPSTAVTGTVSVSNFPVTQPVSGTVTANAGTNLNTSTLALETGGNLASINTKTPALGQALAAASVPVVLTAAQLTTLTPLSSVSVSNFPATQPVSGTIAATQSGTWTNTVTQATGSNLHVVVDTAPTTAVTGTFFQATQPISAVSLPLPTGAATNTVLTNGTQETQLVDGAAAIVGPVQTITGTNYLPVVQASSGTNGSAAPSRTTQVGGSDGTNIRTLKTSAAGVLSVDGSAVTQPVSGTFFQATQPVSLTSTTITGNVNVIGTTADGTTAETNFLVVGGESNDVTAQYQPVPLGTTGRSVIIEGISGGAAVAIQDTPATLCISTTAATGVAVTATLPAVVGQFHYLTGIIVTKYFTVANAASATPLLITTTNLPGALAISMGQPLGTVGTTDVRSEDLATPLKSSVVNTATTIVAPATTGIIWRINVFYYTAP